MERPRPCVSAIVSAQPSVTVSSQLLVAMFSRVAAPGFSASQIVFCPMASNTGCTRSRRSGSPAAITTSLPS